MVEQTPLRVVIVFDGEKWHVRRLKLIEHDGRQDEKVYRCDLPISNDHLTGHAALESALAAIQNAGR